MRSNESARAFPWYDPRQAGGRVFVACVLGALTALALNQFGFVVRAIAAWDAGALMLLGLSWWIIARADAKETRRRASAEDPGRKVVWILVLLSSSTSLIAATLGIQHAGWAKEAGPALNPLCLTAVVCAWLLTHSAYTLRYAHLFYRDDDDIGGLQFPSEPAPDDLDFAYFAFTLGMCYQVSDVSVTSRAMRRTALVHALVSFTYNTVILALAVNLVVGLLQ